MASLRTAHPRLRNYFKNNYIPQVCEALLCGILITCPDDPLRYLEEMIIFIIENGLESLLWDMCIEPSMKPKIRRLSETYMEQLFGLDDQLMTPELMIKACTFYTGHLVKTHFCSWRDVAIMHVSDKAIPAEDLERAVSHYHLQIQKSVFRAWYSYIRRQKEKLCETLLRLYEMYTTYRQKIFIDRWRKEARRRAQIREDELAIEHELQLKTWRNALKSKRTEGLSSESLFDFSENLPFDISLLPERAILQIFAYLTLKDIMTCGQVSHSWMAMIQISSMWNAIDFSTSKTISEKCVVSTLQKWRLNVMCLNFRGYLFQTKTLKAISHCKNLQELNVSDCPSLTDESMKHISEGCPGVLYLNLSNTTITNRTMRLLPRCFSMECWHTILLSSVLSGLLFGAWNRTIGQLGVFLTMENDQHYYSTLIYFLDLRKQWKKGKQ